MTDLGDYIARARQAQQEHAQKHDVQLELVPIVPVPEAEWASEAEINERRDLDDMHAWMIAWANTDPEDFTIRS